VVEETILLAPVQIYIQHRTVLVTHDLTVTCGRTLKQKYTCLLPPIYRPLYVPSDLFPKQCVQKNACPDALNWRIMLAESGCRRRKRSGVFVFSAHAVTVNEAMTWRTRLYRGRFGEHGFYDWLIL